MSTKFYFTLLFTLLLTITSCSKEYKFTLETPKKTPLNSTINVVLLENNNQKTTSIQFFVNGKEIEATGNSTTINTANFGVGKHVVSALVFYNDKSKKINNSFEVLADKPYETYSFKIINEYPHDTGAYTQGLEFYNGFLYETTGRKGESTLRKVELKTGKVLQKIDLDKNYFGEGMTIFNNKISWLTWQGGKGFEYNLDTFEQVGEFAYNQSEEGWGLTHTETELIKSDGSNKIWFLDPETKKEKRFIQVYNHKQSIPYLNELEYFNGKIYANYWKKPLIAIINPTTGVVEGIANLSGLKAVMEKTQKLADDDDVLNGIAFDKTTNRIFVTGKHWGKLFEIELVKEQ